MSDLTAEYPTISQGAHSYNTFVMASRHVLFETRRLRAEVANAGGDTGLHDALIKNFEQLIGHQQRNVHDYLVSLGSCSCGLVEDTSGTSGHLEINTLLPAVRFVRLAYELYSQWEAACDACKTVTPASSEAQAKAELMAHRCHVNNTP